MHTQCREKTRDIDHTFQMVGGQSLVHVNAESCSGSEVHMNNEHLSFLVTRQFPLAKSRQINTHINTRTITTSWAWPVGWNVARGDGHGSVRMEGRRDEGSWGAIRGSGAPSPRVGGGDPQRRDGMSQLMAWWGPASFSVHSDEWEHAMQSLWQLGWQSWPGLQLQLEPLESYTLPVGHLNTISNLLLRPIVLQLNSSVVPSCLRQPLCNVVQNSVHSFCKVESSPHDRPGAIGCLVNTTASQAKRMTRWGGGVALTS